MSQAALLTRAADQPHLKKIFKCQQKGKNPDKTLWKAFDSLIHGKTRSNDVESTREK